MNKPSVRVSVRNGTVTVQFPTELIRSRRSPRNRTKAGWQVLRAVKGMWKGRKPNGLSYQHRARREWD